MCHYIMSDIIWFSVVEQNVTLKAVKSIVHLSHYMMSILVMPLYVRVIVCGYFNVSEYSIQGRRLQ
jgi:hypothetical protein